MTEPRKLKRGESPRSVLVDAARAFMGEGSPRAEGARLVGDPLDAVLGTSIEGLRQSQGGRRNRPHTFAGEIEHNVVQRRRESQAPASAPPVVSDDDQAAKTKAYMDLLAEMDPSDRAAWEAAMDATVAVELGSTAEFEGEFIDWEDA